MDVLAQGLAELGFSGDRMDTVYRAMDAYVRELLLFNAAYDLVGAQTRGEIVVRHILDSLAAVQVLDGYIERLQSVSGGGAADAPVRIGDIGSGAGLPGIPLACAYPSVQFTLIERMSKRCLFLENCCAVLGLGNAAVANEQAERFPKRTLDIIVFRAFKPLERKTAKTLLSLLKTGGLFAAYKARAQRIAEEMADIADLIPNYTAVPLHVPFLADHERHLVTAVKKT